MYQVETSETKTFDFKVNDAIYSVPLFEFMPLKVLIAYKDMAKGNPDGVEIAQWVAENIFEPYAPGCTELLTVGQVVGLIEAYVNASGDLGE